MSFRAFQRLGQIQKWRRLIGLLLPVLLLASSVSPIPVFAAEQLVLESFDGLTAGTTPAGWGVKTSGTSYVRVTGHADGTGHYLQIYDSSRKNTEGIYKPFSAQTGKVTVHADVQMPAGSTPGKASILFYITDSANKPAIALNLRPDRIISFRTTGGVTSTQTLASGLNLETWNSLIVSADFASKTFDLYWNGSPVQSGIPFRYDDVADISKLQITGAYFADEADYIRIVNIDSVSIYSGPVQLSMPPSLQADAGGVQLGQPVTVSYTDDPAWRSAVTQVEVDGTAVSNAVYSLSPGLLTIGAPAFPTAKTYSIAVKAAGYLVTSVQQAVYADPNADLVRESFDTVPADAVPDGWSVQTTGSSYVKVVEPQQGNNRYLQIYDASRRNTEGVTKSFLPQDGKLVVQADIQLPSGATPGKENILFYVLDSTGKAAIALNITPAKIVAFCTEGSVTTSTELASGLPIAGWRSLTIGADQATRTFDFYLDGIKQTSGVPFRYDDTLNLASLKIAGAYYADEANYIRIANVDNVRVHPGEPDIPEPEPVDPPPPGDEARSFDSYSSVFLSSRWWREPGQEGQLGTLDAIKRFAATDDKWTYLNEADKIANIVRQGVSFQGTLNMNDGSAGRAKYFDGTPIVAPWMTWGATWGSMSDPAYYNQVLSTGKKGIDAGATSFQFDDWRGSVDAYQFGGDFCDPCMEKFRQYLDDTYSDSQLAVWGIPDIAAFNYKTYLQSSFNITTNGDYAAKRALSPLDPAFKQFHQEEAISFHTRLRHDLEAYAGTTIEYSNNAPFIRDARTETHFLHDLFDYGMGEQDEASLSMDALVTNGSLASGLGKPHLISPRFENETELRRAIAAAYSLGQYMLVPWDVWLEGSTRYFGTPEQYGDIYRFIRQYPFLLDGHEPPAKVGILVKWNEMNVTTLTELSMKLFQAGVPFKVVVSNDSLPHYEISDASLAGLDTLIAYSPVTAFSTADQTKLTAGGTAIVPVAAITAQWLQEHSAVTVTGAEKLYATVRSTSGAEASHSVHLLNRNNTPVYDAKVTLEDASLFGNTGLQAVLYRPGFDPLPLTAADIGGGRRELTIPELGEWGIVRVGGSSMGASDEFRVPAPWSGMAIGNPPRPGSASVTGSVYAITSQGRGLHVPAQGDPGSSDQLSYVYRHVDATPLQSFELSARLEPPAEGLDGATAGLMVRESAASNARFVAVAHEEAAGMKLLWRDTDDGPVHSTPLADSALPGYVKLARHGVTYSVYYSADGTQWGDALASKDLTAQHVLGGMFAASGASGTDYTASFTEPHFTLGDLSLPPGEMTSLTLSGPAGMEAGKSAELQVLATFQNGGIVTSLDVTGERMVFTSSNPAVAEVNSYGTVTGLSEGEAVISAELTANGMTASGSTQVTVTTPDPNLIHESFDGYGEEEKPPGWTFNTALGSQIGIASMPTDHDKSLRIYDNSASSFPNAIAPFPAQSGPVTIQFDFRADLGAVPSSGGAIVAYLQTSGGGNAVSVLVGEEGFWYLDGTTKIVAAPFENNRWYAVKIRVNPSTRKMDLYIDGIQVVSQGNFRTAADQIGRLQVGGSTGGIDTTAYWNNVQVTAGTQSE